MKLVIVGKVTWLVVAAGMISVISLLGIGYFVNYKQIDQAAGDELIGYASITSGLLNAAEIKQLAQGKTSQELKDKVNWIVDHKSIFKNAAIITSILQERTFVMLKFTLQSGGVFPLAAALIAYLIISRMIKPIGFISMRVQQIAGGDLTGEPIPCGSKDEIGSVNQINVPSAERYDTYNRGQLQGGKPDI